VATVLDLFLRVDAQRTTQWLFEIDEGYYLKGQPSSGNPEGA
jgi:hypothetical protein